VSGPRHALGGERHLEIVVDALARHDQATNRQLRQETGLSRHQVQHALLAAEEVGCAIREGRTAGTVWRLG
jgi:predicted transcriptional regulator